MDERVFATLVREVDDVAGFEPACLDDRALSAALVELRAEMNRLEAAEARITRAWDERRAWAVDDALHPKAWLARETREPKPAIRRRLRAGRAAAAREYLAKAWEAGEISQDHVIAITRLDVARCHEAFVRDEEMLVGFARDLDWGRFEKALSTRRCRKGRVCETDDGQILTLADLARIFFDADIERVVFGPKSRIIDVGRATRLFRGALRRAILARDRTCKHDYCDVPASRCETDHLHPFGAGGAAEQENGECMCGPHIRRRTGSARRQAGADPP